MLNCYETVVRFSRRIYYYDIMNVKSLQNICMSTMKDFYCVIMKAKLLRNVFLGVPMESLIGDEEVGSG
jgi:hypothetical protein